MFFTNLFARNIEDQTPTANGARCRSHKAKARTSEDHRIELMARRDDLLPRLEGICASHTPATIARTLGIHPTSINTFEVRPYRLTLSLFQQIIWGLEDEDTLYTKLEEYKNRTPDSVKKYREHHELARKNGTNNPETFRAHAQSVVTAELLRNEQQEIINPVAEKPDTLDSICAEAKVEPKQHSTLKRAHIELHAVYFRVAHETMSEVLEGVSGGPIFKKELMESFDRIYEQRNGLAGQ